MARGYLGVKLRWELHTIVPRIIPDLDFGKRLLQLLFLEHIPVKLYRNVP